METSDTSGEIYHAESRSLSSLLDPDKFDAVESIGSKRVFNVVNVFYIDRLRQQKFAVPPFFKDHLQNVQFEEGKVLRLRCKVGGYPSPEVEWYKEGERIAEVNEREELGEFIGYKYYATNQNNNLSLTVTGVTGEDFGQYACKIKNAVGEARSTAIVYAIPNSEEVHPHKGKEGEKRKVVIEEKITVVERKPLFSDAQSEFHPDPEQISGESEKDDMNDGGIQSNEQLMTVMFAVPENCETKDLKIKVSKGQAAEILYDDDFPNGQPCADSSQLRILNFGNGTAKKEDASSVDSDSFEERELEFSPTSEGEVNSRVSWIQRGELSDSEYRRNSIPQSLPQFLTEGTDDLVQPISSQTLVHDSATSGESWRKGSEADEDVSEGESKDTVRGDCGRLFSREGVFTFTEGPEYADDRSEFTDVFDDEQGISPRTEVHDPLSEDAVTTLHEFSPLSPDSGGIHLKDLEKVAVGQQGTGGIHGLSQDGLPESAGVEEIVEASYTEGQAQCAPPPVSDGDERTIRETKGRPDILECGNFSVENQSPYRCPVYDYASDEENLKALDELIARLLEFSQRDYVLVSSLKVGRGKKNTSHYESGNATSKDHTDAAAPKLAVVEEVYSEPYKIQKMDIPLHPSDLSAESEDEMEPRKPKFVIPLEDMIVDSAESVVLNISVTGFPAPQISWFKDNQPLNEADADEIKDDLNCKSATYTCIAKNPSGEAVTSAVITVRPTGAEDVEKVNNVGTISHNGVKLRKKKGIASEEKRWSQIISASLVDYLRSKAKSLKLAEDQGLSIDAKETGFRPSEQTGLTRDDVTLRRGSMLSLNSMSTTSFESAEETLTSSDAVWEEVVSTCEEDFMSTDEFFFPGINENDLTKLRIPGHFGDNCDTDDDLFSPRPLTPTPVSEKPPFEYEVTTIKSNRPFTRTPTDPCIFVEDESSENMETAPSNSITPVPPIADDARQSLHDELRPPKFLVTLKDGDLVLGSTYVLTCCIIGNPNPTVTWYRNGIQILPAEPRGKSSPRSFTQPLGGDIQIHPARLGITSEEKRDGANGSGPLRYTSHTLTIKDCRTTDAGEYSVTAVNLHGNASTKASMGFTNEGENVTGASAEFATPHFLAKISDSEGMIDGQATMNFELTGQPEPDVTIFHNREEVDGERYSLTKTDCGKYTFTINNLRLEDEGEVRVCAMNVVGYAECSAELFVDERMVTPTPDRIPQWSDHVDSIDFGVLDIREQLSSQSTAPYFDDIADDVIALPGSEATLSVRVYAWPAPDVYWYKNEEQVLNEGRFSIECTDFGSHVLKIQAINEADAGIYTCVAKNNAGQVSCKAELLLGPSEYLSDRSSDDEDGKESEKRRLKDDYVVCGNIRDGSFSAVRLVKHNESKEEYAAKYIRCTKAEFKDKFLKEVTILKKLSHNTIVRCKDGFETKKHIIIVMEHAGIEWFEFLLEKKDVTEFEISTQVRSLCCGLQYLHEHKVLHLDMKPENIMIKESKMKIIDFGSAKEVKDGEDIFWEYGNPEFAPPEVVHSKPVSSASDMWSLGVIVFVVLSGNTPFLGDSDYATIVQVCEGRYEFDNRYFGSVSEVARDFIKSLLVVESSSRISAIGAQSHKWLQGGVPEMKTNQLSENRLKYFCSRRKWQRSLVGPKSSLTLRSLPSLLKQEYDSTSVAVPRSMMSSYTSSSTVTESEDDTDSVTLDSTPPSSPRSRFDTFRKFSQNMQSDRSQRRSKSSITIEDTIELQKEFKVFTPTVKVTESSPKSSPKLNSKSRRHTQTEDGDAKPKKPEDSKKRVKPSVKPLRLSPLYPKDTLKMLGKKVSFDDDPPNVSAVEEVQSPVFHTASEQLASPPIATKEILLKDVPPVAQMPEVPKPQASSGPPGVTLDRPQSVSKLLKEDRKILKSRRTIDADSHTSTKEKIRKKLSLKPFRRHRSFDTRSLSSSSDDEETARGGRQTSKKENSGGKPKFSLFSRRKRPVTKGSSLDSSTGPPDEKKPDTTSDVKNESPPTAKSPIKGILKRERSRDASSKSDPHLPKSLQKSPSPASVAAANMESFSGPRQHQKRPLVKGMSLDLDMVSEKSESSSRKPSSPGRRRPQYRRGSSVESALPAGHRQRVSGLRGPLLEKAANDDEPVAGMSLRRSTPVLNQGSSLPYHSRSYSGPLSLPSPPFGTGRFSPTLLSPRRPPSSPYRKYSSLQRSFFSQSVDIAGAQLPETVPEYGLNARKSQSQTAVLSTKGLPLPRARSQDRPIERRGRSADRRRSGESYAPYLKAPLVDQGLTHNQTCVTLSCLIDAFPQPEAVWFKGSEELTASDRIEIISEPSISRYQLKIRSTILPDDFGQYTCEAKNAMGTVKTDCKLMQAVAPGKPSAPEFSGTDGRNVWISWNPPTNCAASPISYMLQYREMAAMKWVVVDDCTKDTLYKIENLRPTTSYRFRVRAVNNAGVGPFSKVSQRIQLDPKATVQSLKYAF